MNEYQMMLREIEAKKQELEQRIRSVVQAEVSQWQQENGVPVQSVDIELSDITSEDVPKRYEVTGASVDLDYRP